LDLVNAVKISFKDGVSAETRVGDNIDGGRSGSIHDYNNNREVEIYADKSRISLAMLSSSQIVNHKNRRICFY
jgi:hypothetical protein